MRPEAKLQLQVCEWLQDNYPDAIFHSDLSAGAYVTIGAAMMNKRLQYSNGLPDLYVLEPRHGYHGLALELKTEGTVVFKRDGTLRKDEHLHEQDFMLRKLRVRGWKAEFGIGFEQATYIIKQYLDGD